MRGSYMGPYLAVGHFAVPAQMQFGVWFIETTDKHEPRNSERERERDGVIENN